MTRRHFVLLFVYSLLVPIAASAASLAVDLWTDRRAFMVLTMGLVTVAGMYLVLRWWLGVVRSVGISTAVAWTPARATIAVTYVVTMVGSVGLGYLAYALTGQRFIEGAVTICVSFPLLLALNQKSSPTLPRPKPQEAATLRVSFYMQLVLPVVFALNLALQLLPSHEIDRGFEGLKNWIIPAYFMLIAVFPMNAFFIRKRYLQARADTVGASARV